MFFKTFWYSVSITFVTFTTFLFHFYFYFHLGFVYVHHIGYIVPWFAVYELVSWSIKDIFKIRFSANFYFQNDMSKLNYVKLKGIVYNLTWFQQQYPDSTTIALPCTPIKLHQLLQFRLHQLLQFIFHEPVSGNSIKASFGGCKSASLVILLNLFIYIMLLQPTMKISPASVELKDRSSLGAPSREPIFVTTQSDKLQNKQIGTKPGKAN